MNYSNYYIKEREDDKSANNKFGLKSNYSINRNCLQCGKHFVARGNKNNYKIIRRCTGCKHVAKRRELEWRRQEVG